MSEQYYNLGWFGRHPFFYDIGGKVVDPIRRRAARMMGKESFKIIDIATGTGAHAYEMARLGHDVIGIDLDTNMLAKAQRKIGKDLKLKFIEADGTNLPFSNNEFDAATVSFAIHDVPYEIGVQILKEMNRVVKGDGVIWIIDYHAPLDNLGAKVLFSVARLFESPNYFPFVKRGLDAYIESIGLQLLERSSFLGAVQFTRLKPSSHIYGEEINSPKTQELEVN